MMNSTIWAKNNKVQQIAAIGFWLAVWQLISMYVGETILLVSPFMVLKTVIQLMGTKTFWLTAAASSARIIGGFLLALSVGITLAALSSACRLIKVLLSPLMVTIKSIPVASFIILALLWLNSGQLAVFISFLMVLPIIYTNTLEGILSVDTKLLEMAFVFHVPWGKKVRYFYLPALQPYLLAGCTVGIGMCWKSGVAAEVIGITDGSIGGALYHAKIFLATGEVFAWTAVIVLISIGFEKLFLYVLKNFMESRKHVPYAASSHPGGTTAPFEIALKDIVKAYHGKEILSHVSICLNRGERLCVMGASGRGKTTLAGLLMGIVKADDGEISGSSQVRFSCQFQENRLVEQLSGIENVALVNPALTRREIRQAFEFIGFRKEDMEKAAGSLSGGQKRRVALLRAVLAVSDIVILDEPFNGLDEEVKAVTAAYLSDRIRDRALFMITHEQKDAGLLKARVMHL